MTAPVASGGSEFAGWGFHPLESAALARRTSIPEILTVSKCGPLNLRNRIHYRGTNSMRKAVKAANAS
jgi:hypothetical protein